MEKARSLEAKHQYAEAIKEWDALSKAYPWYPGVSSEVERIINTRRKDKHDALDRWLKQVETAIDNGDYDTASTMIRQAAQQQPDRKLQAMDEKLKEGLKKKRESDFKFTEGSRLLADGDLIEGGKSLYRAFELQPNDQARANSISLLLLGQVRAYMLSDLTSCEALLSHLNRIRPGQLLPPDIREVIAKRQQTSNAGRADNIKQMERLANIAWSFENARSEKALSAVSKKLQHSKLLDSHDLEVRRAAGELLRKVSLKLGGLEAPAKGPKPASPQLPPHSPDGLSLSSIVAAVLLLLCTSGVVFFLSRPHQTGVPVQFSVTPDKTTIEMDGRTCISPNCKFIFQPGDHVVNLHKDGFKSKMVTVTVKPDESTPLNLTAELEPLSAQGIAAVLPVATTNRPQTLRHCMMDITPQKRDLLRRKSKFTVPGPARE